MSEKTTPPTWATSDGVFRSPFNMEAILTACPELLATWKRAPFILLREGGRVIVMPITISVTDA